MTDFGNLNLLCRSNLSFQTSGFIYNIFIIRNDPDIDVDKAQHKPHGCGPLFHATSRTQKFVVLFRNLFHSSERRYYLGSLFGDLGIMGFQYYRAAVSSLITDLLCWTETVLFLW